jgi:HSP20 family protein
MAKTPTSIPLKTEPKAPVPVGQMPWHPLATLRDEMDRLFDDFFTGWPMTPFRRWRLETDPWRRFQGMFEATFPTADVVEGEKDYNITAELPGMSEKDIEIALTGTCSRSRARRRRSMRRRARTATSRNGVTARSSARSSCGSRQDRRWVQERGADDHATEATGGAGQAPEDRGQRQLKLAAWPFLGDALAAPGIPFHRHGLRGVAEGVFAAC